MGYLVIKNANAGIYNLKLPNNSDSGWTALYAASGLVSPADFRMKGQVVINTLIVRFQRIDKFSLYGESFDEHPLFSGYYDDKSGDPDYEIYLEGVKDIKCKSTSPDLDAAIENTPNFDQLKFDVYKNWLGGTNGLTFKYTLNDPIIDDDALKLAIEVGDEDFI